MRKASTNFRPNDFRHLITREDLVDGMLEFGVSESHVRNVVSGYRRSVADDPLLVYVLTRALHRATKAVRRMRRIISLLNENVPQHERASAL